MISETITIQRLLITVHLNYLRLSVFPLVEKIKFKFIVKCLSVKIKGEAFPCDIIIIFILEG